MRQYLPTHLQSTGFILTIIWLIHHLKTRNVISYCKFLSILWLTKLSCLKFNIVKFFGYISLFSLLMTFSYTANAEQASDIYPLDSKAQVAHFQNMLGSLRCLVCQNQNLADSHAPLAKDLKEKVYALVKEGKSDDEIMHYMTDRYGDFVLFNPPVKWVTYLLWLGPVLFALLGGYVFWRSCYQREA